jgi:hypothetical protein
MDPTDSLRARRLLRCSKIGPKLNYSRLSSFFSFCCDFPDAPESTKSISADPECFLINPVVRSYWNPPQGTNLKAASSTFNPRGGLQL